MSSLPDQHPAQQSPTHLKDDQAADGPVTPGAVDALTTALEADPEIAYEPKASNPEAGAANLIKMAIDFGAPLAFGITYFIAGKFGHFADKDMPLLIATSVLVAASLTALLAGYFLEKRIAWMPLIVGVCAVFFGGMTLVFHDTRFIKIKLTVLNLAFGTFLLGGLALKKQPLKAMIGDALPLKEKAWNSLSLYYGMFFVTIAIANEIIWRTQAESVWVTFKSSMFFVTLGFSLCLTPFLMKNMELSPDTADKT